MRLYSTRESATNNVVSVLAIAETVAAVCLTLYIASRIDSLIGIAIAASMAPLLLLRTPESIQLGLEWFNDLKFKCPPRFEWALPILIVISPLIIRVGATLLTVIRQPLKSIRAISSNWYNQAFCVDLCLAPEYLPGYKNSGVQDDLQFSNFSKAMFSIFVDLRDFREFSTAQKAFLILFLPFYSLMIPVFFLVLFGPPLLYRWSLKSTSVVYLPLVWVVHTANQTLPDTRSLLNRIRTSEYEAMMRSFSTLTIFAFAAKLIAMVAVENFVEWWNTTRWLQYCAIYVRPQEIPWWQIASGINAILTWLLYWLAAYTLERMDHPDAFDERNIEKGIRATYTVQKALSIYSIVCTLAITIAVASHLKFPHFGTKMFPWM